MSQNIYVKNVSFCVLTRERVLLRENAATGPLLMTALHCTLRLRSLDVLVNDLRSAHTQPIIVTPTLMLDFIILILSTL